MSAVVILTLILAVQIVPLAQRNEQFFGGAVADKSFQDALNYLASYSAPGSVLADSGHTAHWVEAATARDTYFPGPTWIHFYPYQIVRDEESYWALNSAVALTDNQVTLSYSGTNDSTLYEAPMYSAYIEGVIFPILRIDPTTLSVNTTRIVGTSTVPESNPYNASWVSAARGSPSLQYVNSSPAQGWYNFTTSNFTVSIYSTVGPGGQATVVVSAGVAPNRTSQQISGIAGVSFRVMQPPSGPKLVRFGNLNSANLTSTQLFWNVTNRLGSLPGNYFLPTTATFSTPATGSLVPVGARRPAGAALAFANPAVGPSYSVTIVLSTPGTSNPAVHLQGVLDSRAFLDSQGIQLMVMPKFSGTGTITTTNYMRQEFNLKVLGPGNPEWIILTR